MPSSGREEGGVDLSEAEDEEDSVDSCVLLEGTLSGISRNLNNRSKSPKLAGLLDVGS